jgi:hypothetical protein
MSHHVSYQQLNPLWVNTSCMSHHFSYESPHLLGFTTSLMSHHISKSQRLLRVNLPLWWVTTSLLSIYISYESTHNVWVTASLRVTALLISYEPVHLLWVVTSPMSPYISYKARHPKNTDWEAIEIRVSFQCANTVWFTSLTQGWIIKKKMNYWTAPYLYFF